MADEELEGIGVGRTSSEDIGGETDVEKLLGEFEVAALADLSDEELKLISDVIGGEEELEGIRRGDGDIIRRGEAEEQIRQEITEIDESVTNIDRDVTFESNLDDIQDIEDVPDLLRQIAASSKTTNSLLEGISNQLDSVENKLDNVVSSTQDLIDVSSNFPQLAVKDSDVVEFARARDSRDLTEDTGVETSIVILKANAKNEGDIFLGKENVDIGNGFRIEPGEKQPLNVNVLNDSIKSVAEQTGDSYTYIGLGSL